MDTAKFYYNEQGNPTAIVHTLNPPEMNRAMVFKYTADGRLSWILRNYVKDSVSGLEYSVGATKVETTVPASIDPYTYNTAFTYVKSSYKSITLDSDGVIIDSTLNMLDGEYVIHKTTVQVNDRGHLESIYYYSSPLFDDTELVNNDEWGNNIAIFPEYDTTIYSYSHTHLVWKILRNNFDRNAPASDYNKTVETFGSGAIKYPVESLDGLNLISYNLPSFKYRIEYEPKP